MTDISKTSEQSLNNILNKLGVKTQDQAAKEGKKTSLGQEDFLKLMTTQLQNQDPFAPMDNGDFIAQMAQFSTVTGITEINNNLTTFDGIDGQFRFNNNIINRKLDVLKIANGKANLFIKSK